MALFLSCKKQVVPANNKPDINEISQKEYVIDKDSLRFSDEFNYEGKPSPKYWSYDIGGNGWGNQELQFYTDSLKNAHVSNGTLKITAINEFVGNNQYSSARLVTKGNVDFTYGRIEVKAKLPRGLGTWPAIWMLASQTEYGTAYWPDNGEIDIMEHVGFDQNNVHANIHTKAFNHSIGTNKGATIIVDSASKDFHVYACEWLPNSLTFYVDNKEYFKFLNSTSYGWEQWPFNRQFHLLLNIAVGGTWGGQKGVDSSVFPQTMEIDYVRVYAIKEK